MKKKEAPAKSSPPKTRWKRGELLKRCGLRVKDLRAAGADWRELGAIHDDFLKQGPTLESAGKTVADHLRRVPEVHSVRVRLKDPGGLIRKIVRKTTEDPDREIRLENYRDEITDLVGLRALHLLKEEWLAIHRYILKHWNVVEEPVANVRKGDNPRWLESFSEHGCVTRVHERDYRSVHYVVETSPTRETCRVEIQTRTLLEEAWAELDHRINYPISTAFAGVQDSLSILNRIAGSADELASFASALENTLRAEHADRERLEEERDAASDRIEELLQKLQLKKSQEEQLRSELRLLRDRTASEASPTFGSMRITPSSLDPSGSFISTSTGPLYAAAVPQNCLRCGKTFTRDPSSTAILAGGDYCDECQAAPFTITADSWDWKTCTTCGAIYRDGMTAISSDKCPSCYG